MLARLFDWFDSISEFVKKDHRYSIREKTLLNLLTAEECFKGILKKHGVDSPSMQCGDNMLTFRGHFLHNSVSGTFSVSVRPRNIVWKTQQHDISLELVDSDVQFNHTVSGTFMSAVQSVSKNVFGKDWIADKIEELFPDGVITIHLNELFPAMDLVFSLIDLQSLIVIPGVLQIDLRFKPETIKSRPAETMLILERLKLYFVEAYDEQKEQKKDVQSTENQTENKDTSNKEKSDN